jgi:hypothetical protein
MIVDIVLDENEPEFDPKAPEVRLKRVPTHVLVKMNRTMILRERKRWTRRNDPHKGKGMNIRDQNDGWQHQDRAQETNANNGGIRVHRRRIARPNFEDSRCGHRQTTNQQVNPVQRVRGAIQKLGVRDYTTLMSL